MTLERIHPVSHGAPNSFSADAQRSTATSPDPNNTPDVLNDLRTRAMHLHAAALQGAGATRQQRAQTEALVHWADELEGRGQIRANDLEAFEYAIDGFPARLRWVAGHSAALQADRDEFRRLQAALNGAATHIPGQHFTALLANAELTAGLFPAAYEALDAGRAQDLHDHVSSIRSRITSLRGALERRNIIRPEDRLPAMQHPDPASFPAMRKDEFSPLNLLGSAMSRVAQAAKRAPRDRADNTRASRPGRRNVSAAAKDLKQLAQRARADVLKSQVMTVRQTLDKLNLDLVGLASESRRAGDREWALATQNGLLRQQATRLDKLTLRLNDNRSFGTSEEAELRQVSDTLKNVSETLSLRRRAASPATS